MKVFNIRLSTIEEVRNFVNIVSKYDYEIDLKSGRYVVDAKSIMGILVFGVRKPVPGFGERVKVFFNSFVAFGNEPGGILLIFSL